jgi:Fur family ferric uptake transcriptional regulator
VSAERKARATRQRQVILQELRAIASHPAADEVYEMVRRRLPHISLGTVYRNLNLRSEQGEIQKLTLGCTQSRFDGNPQAHHHVRCTACGCVADMPIGPVPEIAEAARGVSDYELTGHCLEFLGLCPACK